MSEAAPVVLCVDDNPVNLRLLSEMLADTGYTLLMARSGARALEVARRRCPTLVLLDIKMPEMDGFEVCRRLKSDPDTSSAAVIFLSALRDAASKVKGLEVGAVDFVSKPFEVEEVLARVRTHLRIKALEQQLARRNAELQHELAVAQELLRDARERVDSALLGDSELAVALRNHVERAARQLGPTLLVGPPGTGEEAVARAIHHQSSRSARPLLVVHGLEVERDPRVLDARFELARGGTLFVPRAILVPEARLERLLAEAVEADVHLIVHHVGRSWALPTQLRSGCAYHVALPELADRLADLPVIADRLVARRAEQLGRSAPRVSEASLRRLSQAAWPGNFAELGSVLECALMVCEGDVLEVDEALLEGGIRVGDYLLREKLGQGGMGEVWVGKHRLLDREAAVKLIRAEVADPDAARRRFEREARVIAALESPNTVRLYDFGMTVDGAFYYVMERLRGLDLGALVAREGPLSPARAVYLVEQAAASLAEAHDAGLVHCDIKPENLFVCSAGAENDVLKVLDFGIVRTVDDHRVGELAGTPAFLSPEQAQGDSLDGRADLYALGCVLFFTVTGEPVFPSTGVKVILDHLGTEPRRVRELRPEVPAALDALVHELLAKRPSDRPADAETLRRRLRALPLPTWVPRRGKRPSLPPS
jgi:DNA-binding NtrC family response regulator